MTDEPYRWLEAVANRREYIRDQLKGGTPVFAFSRPQGVLLCGLGTGQSKVFEIYDRHALASLGHPVDIEKVRQSVIEAAHMEGFTRAAEDVTLRRLLNSALGPLLKNSFEQIFAAPLLAELILAEVSITPAQDVLARVSYDGTHRILSGGVAVAHTNPADENAAVKWLSEQLRPETSLEEVMRLALRAERELMSGKPFGTSTTEGAGPAEGRVLEVALLDRSAPGRVRYRSLSPFALS
jgi:proteasome alpha subunit